ncbi:prohibitin family protein [Endothiovibrio diazotrophicus]
MKMNWLFRLHEKVMARAHYIIVALIIFLLVFIFYFKSILVIVGPGEGAVLYRLFFGGTVTDQVFGEGLHFVAPWNRMYVYNTRIQTKRHEFRILTNRGLPITLTLAVRYRPQYDMLGVMHQQVGQYYVDTIVIPQIESVLRKNIGKQDPEVVYSNKGGILNDIILRAIEEVSRKFVVIDDIIIRTVELPEDVRGAIEEKLVEEQKELAYEFKLKRARQEAARKKIEAEGIRDYQKTIAETLDDKQLRWKGIEATRELSTSENAKVVVIGAGEDGLPIILGR